MAQQAKKKAVQRVRRSGAPSAKGASVSKLNSDTLRVELEAVSRDRDEALRKLASAEKRIAELEGVQEKVANRIDWVIDSLHGLKDRDP